MRFKPIVLGLALIIGGVASATFSLPPYPVQLPGQIEAVKGQPASLPLGIWNLRTEPISVTYLGDCCTLPKTVELPPFSYRKLEIGIETDNLPQRLIQKAATLQYKVDGRTQLKVFPYSLKVSEQ